MEQPLQFQLGDYLLRQGEMAAHAFMIESGSVKITIRNGNAEQVLSVAGIGEVIGEMALFEDAPRSASVIALEPTLAQRITRESLHESMQTDPAACMPFLRAVLDRLRTSNTMLLAAQQTKELVKTTRVHLSLEPLSDAARQICQKAVVIKLDVIPSENITRLLVNELQKHFKVEVKTFLPDMQR